MAYYKEITSTEPIPTAAQKQNNENFDLIKGKKPLSVTADAPIRELHKTEYFNTTEDNFTITNGVTCVTPDYLDKAFTHFSCGTGREIVYRFDNLSAVSGFSISFLRQDKVGVGMPYIVDILLSENGKDWMRVSKNRRIPTDNPEKVFTLEKSFDKKYKAGFVKLKFSVSLHIWIENFSVFGCTDISDAACITPDNDDGVFVNAFPDYSALDGVRNIILAYTCFPKDDERTGQLTYEEALRYVGYYDKSGKVTDTFADGFLFLPYSKFTYSKWYKCAEGWKYYIDRNFDDNLDVDALDKACATISDALEQNITASVFLSILHTNVRYGEKPDKFGSLDGRELDMNNPADRKYAVKWCIDEQLKRYREKERIHTKLVGFYWFEEAINYNDEFEVEVLKFAADYVHSLGYKLIWIPYQQANGYTDWKELGFDVACMQPNYAFRPEEKPTLLYENAELTKKYGMCYELELNGITTEHDVGRYREYLKAGAETGFMHTIKMYYQGGRCFYAASISDNELTRSVYDDTYLFAKEKYGK